MGKYTTESLTVFGIQVACLCKTEKTEEVGIVHQICARELGP